MNLLSRHVGVRPRSAEAAISSSRVYPGTAADTPVGSQPRTQLGAEFTG
ncbi:MULTISPECIES: hypothetical protein [unclassified Saccharopolyspora]|nr:hypothetical protein [Saccharopolyspora sp. HNM0986]MBK0869238.1 hypothetical protein [Saccharopolyspora sp. HNM0986]